MSEQDEKREAIQGIFSSHEVRKVGTGTTSRKSIQKAFWFCVELPDGNIEMQPLNTNYIPSGPKRKVEKDQFLKTFSPEPEFYVSTVFPRMRELNKTLARGDRHRKNKEYYSAEMEYGSALKVDEENVRANFGLGITYLERGESARADDIFNRLVKLDAAFDQEHKHLFNEFGINLRKNGMFDQAISYYGRALELSAQDENLYYNMARATLEKNDVPGTVEYLLKSLELNPGLEESARFLLWMLSKNMLPPDKQGLAVAALKKAKEAQAATPPAAGRAAEEGSGNA